jgi:hypothetical protein
MEQPNENLHIKIHKHFIQNLNRQVSKETAQALCLSSLSILSFNIILIKDW